MTTRTYTRDELLELTKAIAPVINLAPDFDGGDPWGSVMGLWFDTAEILAYRGDEIPAEWEYRGSIREPGELNELLGDHASDYLRLLGNYCYRAADTLRALELDY